MKKQSRQSQDKPQTKIRIKTRRAKLVKLFAEGKTVRQAQKIINSEGIKASRALVGFDLQALAREAPQCVEDAREEARIELRCLKQIIRESERLHLKDQAMLLLQIHDRYSRLLGLDAPAKQINANFTPTLPGLVAIDFGEGVEKTPNLVSEAEYMEEVEEAKLPFAKEMAKLEQP
jgi:hypothetical protein